MILHYYLYTVWNLYTFTINVYHSNIKLSMIFLLIPWFARIYHGAYYFLLWCIIPSSWHTILLYISNVLWWQNMSFWIITFRSYFYIYIMFMVPAIIWQSHSLTTILYSDCSHKKHRGVNTFYLIIVFPLSEKTFVG